MLREVTQTPTVARGEDCVRWSVSADPFRAIEPRRELRLTQPARYRDCEQNQTTDKRNRVNQRCWRAALLCHVRQPGKKQPGANHRQSKSPRVRLSSSCSRSECERQNRTVHRDQPNQTVTNTWFQPRHAETHKRAADAHQCHQASSPIKVWCLRSSSFEDRADWKQMFELDQIERKVRCDDGGLEYDTQEQMLK